MTEDEQAIARTRAWHNALRPNPMGTIGMFGQVSDDLLQRLGRTLAIACGAVLLIVPSAVILLGAR